MNLLGDIVEILRGRPSGESQKLHYGRVPNVSGWAGYDPRPVQPGTAYVQWHLAEMWLHKERQWLDHYYPLVYAATSVQFGGDQVQLPRTLGSFDLATDHDFTNLQDALRLNYPMTGLLPWNGGSVELAAALVGIRSSAGLSTLVTAIGELGGALAVPQLSAVSAFAAPIGATIEALLGQGDSSFVLGLHQAFQAGGPSAPGAGYYLCGDYPGEFRFDRVAVVDDRLVRADNGAPVRDFNYMLFRLQVSNTRDDLESLTAIFDLVRAAESAAITRDGMPVALSTIQDAKRTAWQSTDLTVLDRRRVPVAIDERFNDYLKLMGVRGTGAALGSPADLDRSVLDRIGAVDPGVMDWTDEQMRRVVLGG